MKPPHTVKPPLKYVECPRDAWQGLTSIIPTKKKISYLQRLLDAGFKHLDMGSFVSPKAVAQLADTHEVLAGLKPPSDADLLCIIANERGLERAIAAPNLRSVGYPFSVNDTFQRRNTRRSVAASWPLVKTIQRDAAEAGLKLTVYLSMGFGNPYGEAWTPQDTAEVVARLRGLGIDRLVLADTVGTATPDTLENVLDLIPDVQALGLHLHARSRKWQAKVEVGIQAGVRWFEGVLGGLGGCPFAGDALVGNLPTEDVLPFLAARFELEPNLLHHLPALKIAAKNAAEHTVS